MVEKSFCGAQEARTPNGGDLVDRLSCRLTPWLLLVFAIVLGIKDFIFKSIACRVPKQLQHLEEFLENYCWVSGTYHLPPDQHSLLLHSFLHSVDKSARVDYYQWTVVLLIAQAALFCLPALAWQLIGPLTGLNVEALLTMAAESLSVDVRARERALEAAEKHLAHSLQLLSLRLRRRDCCSLPHAARPRLLSAAYLLFKVCPLHSRFSEMQSNARKSLISLVFLQN